jgi:CRP-like cAMP-binding protein
MLHYVIIILNQSPKTDTQSWKKKERFQGIFISCVPDTAVCIMFLSFINQKVSKEHLECLTDCSLLRIKRTDLEKLISMSEAFKAFSLVVFQHAIASSLERADELATTDAETRYRKLMDTRPELVQNVPIQYLASYLGIKAPSLSRIRRKIKF